MSATAWVSGPWTVHLTDDPLPERQRPAVPGAEVLTRFLAEVEPADLPELADALAAPRQTGLAARAGRDGWLLDPLPERGAAWEAHLWRRSTGRAVSADLRPLVLAVELYARNVLLATDGVVVPAGSDGTAEGLPAWVVPLREAHVALLARLAGAGLARLAPETRDPAFAQE
jgi:hypothetical protein